MSAHPARMRLRRLPRSTRAPTNGAVARPARANIAMTRPMPSGPACSADARIFGSSTKIENEMPKANCRPSSKANCRVGSAPADDPGARGSGALTESSFLDGLGLERDRVDAEALAARPGAVVEDVAEVPA